TVMSTIISLDPLLVHPLVRLHVVLSDFQLERHKLTFQAHDEVGSAFRAPPCTVNIEVLDTSLIEILHAPPLKLRFSAHPSSASRSIAPVFLFPDFLGGVGASAPSSSSSSSNPDAGDFSPNLMKVTVFAGSLRCGCTSCSTTASM